MRLDDPWLDLLGRVLAHAPEGREDAVIAIAFDDGVANEDRPLRMTIPLRANGGEDMNRPISGSEAMAEILTYARHHKEPGESEEEAIARACSEQPELYRRYDLATSRGWTAEQVQAHLAREESGDANE